MNSSRQKASSPDISAYISASAGSGKTTILIDRILRLLLLGHEFDQILCLTFTNAAANEMLHRLTKRLECWALRSDQSDMIEELKSLCGVMPTHSELAFAASLYEKTFASGPKIHTIHSFCADILRSAKFFVDEETLLTSPAKKRQLIKMAFDQVLIKSNGVEAIYRSLCTMSSYYDYDVILNLICDALSQQNRINRYLERYVGNEANSEINKEFSLILQEVYDDCIRRKTGKRSLCASSKIIEEYVINVDQDVCIEILSALQGEGERIHSLFQKWVESDISSKIKMFGEYSDIFLTQQGEERKRIVSTSFMSKFPEFMEILRSHQKEVLSVSKILAHQESVALTASLQVLVTATQLLYLKGRGGLFEYDDVLSRAIGVLNEDFGANTTMYELHRTIKHVLIDEAQDLSDLQWDLVKILINEFCASEDAVDHTLCIVGDFKQSIYGFQGAKPQLFLEIRDFFHSKFLESQKSFELLEINECFRCPSKITNLVDSVLERVGWICQRHLSMSREIGVAELWDIDHGYAKRYEKNGTNRAEGKIRVSWDNRRKDRAKESGNFTESFIAEQIKSRILKRLESDTPVRALPGEIMILFKKRSLLQKVLIEQLDGLPVQDLTSKSSLDHMAVYDLLALARFVISPFDEMNLAILLKSPIIGVTEQELLNLSYNRDQNLFHRVVGSTGGFYGKYLNSIIEAYKESLSVTDFYIRCLYEHGILNKLTDEFGTHVLDVIHNFALVTEEFDKKNFGGLYRFISYIENQEFEKQSKILMDEESIKIVTAHGAKGLESEIVILADAGYSEHMRRDSIVWDQWDQDYSLNRTNSVVMDTAVKHHRKEVMKEDMRLLYVAMTRAKRELYVVGNKDTSSNASSWYNVVRQSMSDG